MATRQVQDIVSEIEHQAVKRIFRKGEAADLVLADLRRLSAVRMAALTDDQTKFPSWLQSDLAAVTARTPSGYTGFYCDSEKPGYFEQGAST